MPEDDIQIRIVNPEDYGDVLDFLRIHFFPHEPLVMGREPKNQHDAADEEFSMSNIKHGTCLMAVQKDKEEKKEIIVGALLSGPKDSHEAERLLAEIAKLDDCKWRCVLRLLARVESEANVCVKFNVNKVLHGHALVVNSRLRGKGIASRLKQQWVAIASRLGYPLLSCDCTSLYSARLCEKFNMECIYTLRYADYFDEQGKQVFQPPAPHDALRTFVLRLQ